MVDGASGSTTNYQSLWALRCAQPVVCSSMSLKSSYITIAIAPTTTSPLNARQACFASILPVKSASRPCVHCVSSYYYNSLQKKCFLAGSTLSSALGGHEAAVAHRVRVHPAPGVECVRHLRGHQRQAGCIDLAKPFGTRVWGVDEGVYCQLEAARFQRDVATEKALPRVPAKTLPASVCSAPDAAPFSGWNSALRQAISGNFPRDYPSWRAASCRCQASRSLKLRAITLVALRKSSSSRRSSARLAWDSRKERGPAP